MDADLFEEFTAHDGHATAAQILAAIAALPFGFLKPTWLTMIKRAFRFILKCLKSFYNIILQRLEPSRCALFSFVEFCHREGPIEYRAQALKSDQS